MMSKEEKLQFFSDMIRSCQNLHLWQYSPDLSLLASTCPDGEAMEILFDLDSIKSELANAFAESRDPLILTNPSGLMWTAAASVSSPDPPYSSTLSASPASIREIIFLGPYFIDDSAGASIERSLHAMNLSHGLLYQTRSFLRTLPVLTLSKVMDFSVMLHYALTGENISISSLRHINTDSENEHHTSHDRQFDNKEDAVLGHVPYAMEREMLRMVREGDLTAFQKIEQLGSIGSTGKLAGTPDRQMKDSILVEIVLFSRAAIEGGLPSKLSMDLAEQYFRGVEASRSIPDLISLSRTIQNDYIRRVHEIRKSQGIPAIVRDVNAYIELHLEEPIRLAEMASSLGYTPYYLSRRYQKETGTSVSETIRKKRIERAKELLMTTSESIHDISEQLCFTSPSYFIEIFRKVEGMTPGEYRNQYGSGL